MKALVFSMLAIASMVACTSESDPINEVDNEKPVEIKLNAGIITTKAPIESTGNLPKADLTEVQFVKAEDGSIVDWSSVSATATSGTISKTDGAITFNSPLVYNVDRATKSFIIGYYPAGTVGTGAVSWDITGNSDIIIAKEVSGSKETPITQAVEFKHMLTQLRFKVKADSGADWGDITDITIRKADDTNLNTKASYTLASADPSILTWSVPSQNTMPIYQVVGGVYNDDVLSGGNVALSTTSTLIGYIMVEPLGLSDYELVVKTTNNTVETVVGLTLTENAVIGKAYEINLNFAASTITAKATIADWVPVADGGSGSVE